MLFGSQLLFLTLVQVTCRQQGNAWVCPGDTVCRDGFCVADPWSRARTEKPFLQPRRHVFGIIGADVGLALAGYPDSSDYGFRIGARFETEDGKNAVELRSILSRFYATLSPSTGLSPPESFDAWGLLIGVRAMHHFGFLSPWAALDIGGEAVHRPIAALCPEEDYCHHGNAVAAWFSAGLGAVLGFAEIGPFVSMRGSVRAPNAGAHSSIVGGIGITLSL